MSLKSQVIECLSPCYLTDKRNRLTQYLGVTTIELIDHLLNHYRKITPKDLKETKDRMDASINTSQPISV